MTKPGPKPIYGETMKEYRVRLDEKHEKAAKRLGDGKVAPGVRKALEMAERGEEYLLSELNFVETDDAWPDDNDDGVDMMSIPYLCVIDWQHFSPSLTAMTARLELCYWTGLDFVSFDDDGCLSGPVKCVRSWARV
jgi:hypothetical protein